MIPGPRSRALAHLLRRFECPEVTYLSKKFPVFWSRASGCRVTDADQNRYVDMTAAFAVANLGHSHPAITRAIARQAGRLLHGMGDVHPPAIKADFLAALARILPKPLRRIILSQNGSDAVESAIKTAMVARPGRGGIVAFTGSYHGLSFGALATTWRKDFRAPFAGRLCKNTLFADYPYCYRCPLKKRYPDCGIACLDQAIRKIRRAGGNRRFSAVIVEPIQGRGGEIVPPPGWLSRLSAFCRREGILLIADEIYTGFGRTGRMFACQHDGVVPDLMCLGKGMTGGFPISACAGSPAVMDRWGKSTGEAVHTSTFLGNPLGCAAGLAALSIYKKRRLDGRAAALGRYFLGRLRQALSDMPAIGDIRGRGLMIGIELVRDRASKTPAPDLCARAMEEALRHGLLILGGGVHRNVISISPPLTVSRREIDFCVEVLQDVLHVRL